MRRGQAYDCMLFRPYGTSDSAWIPSPPMNRWAIFGRPDGTDDHLQSPTFVNIAGREQLGEMPTLMLVRKPAGHRGGLGGSGLESLLISAGLADCCRDMDGNAAFLRAQQRFPCAVVLTELGLSTQSGLPRFRTRTVGRAVGCPNLLGCG